MQFEALEMLNRAAQHMKDRAATYDQPGGERSMGRAVAALNTILGRDALTESEGWLLLQLLKDVRDRQRTRPHQDSLEDAIAYAALKAEARLNEYQPSIEEVRSSVMDAVNKVGTTLSPQEEWVFITQRMGK